MSFSSDEVNYLIYRYLKESGFQHTAFTFGYESNIVRADVNPTEVAHGALINIVQKGLLYLDIEREVKGTSKDSEPTVLVRSLNNALSSSGAVTTTNSNTGAAPTRTKKEGSGSASSKSGTAAKSSSLSYSSRSMNPPSAAADTFQQPAATRTQAVASSHSSSYSQQQHHQQQQQQQQQPHATQPSSTSASGPTSSTHHHHQVPPITMPARPTSPAMDVDIMGLSPSRQSPEEAPSSPIARSSPKPPPKSREPSDAPSSTSSASVQSKALGKTSTAAAATTGASTKTSGPTSSAASTAPSTAASTSAPPATRQARLQLKGHTAEVVACSWNPHNAELLATCSSDSTVRLWTIQQGMMRAASAALHHGAKVKPGMTPPSQVLTVQWNPAGTCLATACFDGSVRLWDAGVGVAKTQLNVKLSAHAGAVFSLRWNSNGTLLSSAGADRSLCIWNPSSKALGTATSASKESLFLARKYERLHDEPILDVDFGSNDFVATASVDKTIKVLKLARAQDGSIVKSESGASDSSSAMATDSTENTQSTSGTSIHNNSDDVKFVASAHTMSVNAVRWSPHVSGLFASASDDSTVRLWNVPVEEGEASSSLVGASEGRSERSSTSLTTLSPSATLNGHTKEVYQLRWNPTISQLASASFDSTVRLWDPQSSSFASQTLQGHTEAVIALDYAPSGHLLASGSQDKTLCIWDARSGTMTRQFTASGAVLDVALNPAEDRVAACFSDNTAVVFDLKM